LTFDEGGLLLLVATKVAVWWGGFIGLGEWGLVSLNLKPTILSLLTMFLVSDKKKFVMSVTQVSVVYRSNWACSAAGT